jgi:hypothetical protein
MGSEGTQIQPALRRPAASVQPALGRRAAGVQLTQQLLSSYLRQACSERSAKSEVAQRRLRGNVQVTLSYRPLCPAESALSGLSRGNAQPALSQRSAGVRRVCSECAATVRQVCSDYAASAQAAPSQRSAGSDIAHKLLSGSSEKGRSAHGGRNRAIRTKPDNS